MRRVGSDQLIDRYRVSFGNALVLNRDGSCTTY